MRLSSYEPITNMAELKEDFAKSDTIKGGSIHPEEHSTIKFISTGSMPCHHVREIRLTVY